MELKTVGNSEVTVRGKPGRKPIVLDAGEYADCPYKAVRHWASQGLTVACMTEFLKISELTFYRRLKTDPELKEALEEGRKERTKSPYEKKDKDYWERFAVYRKQKSHEKMKHRNAVFNSIEWEDPIFDTGWIGYKNKNNTLSMVRIGDFNHLLKLVERAGDYSAGNNVLASQLGPDQESNAYPQHGY